MQGRSADMGAESAETDVVTRSGSALDINQMIPGGAISITGSTFTKCGDPKDIENDKITSGAIKIKIRGAEGDEATDIPKIATPGKFTSVTISGCTFGGGENNALDNRYDVVLGTSGYSSTADESWLKTIQEGCSIEKNYEPKSGTEINESLETL